MWPPHPERRPRTFQVSLSIRPGFYPLRTGAAFSVGEMNSRPGPAGQHIRFLHLGAPPGHSEPPFSTHVLTASPSVLQVHVRHRNEVMFDRGQAHPTLRLAPSGSEAASPCRDVTALGFAMFLCKPRSGLQMIRVLTLGGRGQGEESAFVFSQAEGGICGREWAEPSSPET